MTNTATLHTSLGDIVIELFPNHAPKTVENFVGLATGAKSGPIHAQARNQLKNSTTEQFSIALSAAS